MKNVYRMKQYVRINGGEWFKTSKDFIYYLDEEEVKKLSYHSQVITVFSEIVRFTKIIHNVEIGKTLFTKKITLDFWDRTNLEHRYYTERTIHSLEMKEEYELKICSIKDLAELLTADDFCNYLVDRNIKFQIGVDK